MINGPTPAMFAGTRKPSGVVIHKRRERPEHLTARVGQRLDSATVRALRGIK